MLDPALLGVLVRVEETDQPWVELILQHAVTQLALLIRFQISSFVRSGAKFQRTFRLEFLFY